MSDIALRISVFELLLFAYLLAGPAFLLPGMVWRALNGRGAARGLAAASLLACAALALLALADLIPNPDHHPHVWVLLALPAALWLGSALHPGRGARWPDALALLGPPVALIGFALFA